MRVDGIRLELLEEVHEGGNWDGKRSQNGNPVKDGSDPGEVDNHGEVDPAVGKKIQAHRNL